MFKGLDPKINIPHRKTNFSEKHTSIDISFETVLFGFIDSSWGDLTLEQCCILSKLADSLMPRTRSHRYTFVHMRGTGEANIVTARNLLL